jgi:hypothetical protein
MSEKIDVQEVVIEGQTYVPKDSLVIQHDENYLKSYDDMIGKAFYIQTVTYHSIGKVIAVLENNFLVLEGSCWVADTPRFMNFIQNGKLDEIEPIGNEKIKQYVNIESIVNFMPWTHALPKEQQ